MATTILVTGATGKQGGQTIRSLLEHDKLSLQLRFITRNPTSLSAQSLTAKGVQTFKADLFDRAALDIALRGVQRAFLVTDAGVGEEKEKEQGKIFVDAAKAAGVQHIVFASVCAADTAETVPHFRSKGEIEKHLKASGMSYTILRPVAFMDNFPTEPGFTRFMTIGFFFSAFGRKKVKMVATRDIGIVASKALISPHDPTFRNAIIDLAAGDYRLEDVRKAFQSAQGGRAPWFASYMPKLARNILPYDFKMMMKFFEHPGYPEIDMAKLRQIHSGLMSLEDWVKRGPESNRLS